MKVKRHFLVMVALGLALCLTGSPAWGVDFYVVAGGGTSGKVLKTQVFTSSTTNDTLGTGTWAKLDSPLWTYTKLSATSYLVITYQDTINGTGGWSYYQLRVNDQPSVAGVYGPELGTSSWIIGGTTGVWSQLPKGDVNLSIWHRKDSGCTACSQNAPGLTTNVVVMEIEH
jgi:hypothetical protein